MLCWNCVEDGDIHTEFDVQKDGKLVWCGHEVKCN